MKYRVIGTDPATRRSVSVLSLGAMLMGTRTDEETSFAILDRYVAAGGTFIDTSGNYAFWVNGTQGGESEELLGRWRRSRGLSGSDEDHHRDQGGGAAVGAELWVFRRRHGRACRARWSGSPRRGACPGWGRRGST